MSKKNGLHRMYDRLEAEERFRLDILAMARGDMQEPLGLLSHTRTPSPMTSPLTPISTATGRGATTPRARPARTATLRHGPKMPNPTT
jgi:hypothetical protein